MTTAIITLSREGAIIAQRLRSCMADAEVYVHADVEECACAKRFERVMECVAELFDVCRRLVFIMPTGVAVRAIAPCIKHKTSDPACVVVDVGGRWAVSLLSGHEGGANDLAIEIANILDAEPVISTTTEAVKDIIVGVGCRRGTPAEQIIAAIESALQTAAVPLSRVRLLASADLKSDEAGLLEAARRLALPLRLISSAQIRSCSLEFNRSEFVQSKVDLPAVAEPAALLAGRRTQLILPKQIHPAVTVALARESFLWSE